MTIHRPASLLGGLEADDSLTELDCPALFLDPLGSPFPHHAGSETWIPEGIDERLDDVVAFLLRVDRR